MTLLLGALLSSAPRASAQIALTFIGTPRTMIVNSATAGAPPNSVLGDGCTWSLVGTYALHPRIQARLATTMPAGTRLEILMEAPVGGRSFGWVTLTTTPQNIVDRLPLVSLFGLGITYRLSATSGAGVVPLSSRAVVFTLEWDP